MCLLEFNSVQDLKAHQHKASHLFKREKRKGIFFVAGSQV